MGNISHNHSGSRSHCKKSKQRNRKRCNKQIENFKSECHQSQKYPFDTYHGFKLKTFFIDEETLINRRHSRKKFESSKFDIIRDENGNKKRNKSKNNHIKNIIKRTKLEILRDHPELKKEKNLEIILHKETMRILTNFGMDTKQATDFYNGKLPRDYKIHHPIPLELGGKHNHIMVLPCNVENKLHKFIDSQETDKIVSGRLKVTIPVPRHAIPRFNPNFIDKKEFSNDLVVNGWNPNNMAANDKNKFERRKLLKIYNDSRSA